MTQNLSPTKGNSKWPTVSGNVDIPSVSSDASDATASSSRKRKRNPSTNGISKTTPALSSIIPNSDVTG
eukprot:CAMPEP_0117452946 /NCGR_PEP_ID=MMETSP0759-20121206/9924_1 /TAXON_ID=63605 /ORGANISM="Percolomonas cosmopolitus, Strain WS" /LENGTH=68 /DNA_ID=CAMNT_0005245871 /DNA_START=128 /DNA_END=331 /DNA_ORIENTATION=-